MDEERHKESKPSEWRRFRILSDSSIENLLFLSVLVLIIIVPFGKGGNLSGAIFIRQSFIITMLCVWLFNFMRMPRPLFKTLGLEAPILIFLILCLISYGHSNYRYSTQLEMTQILIYVFYLYVCFQVLDRSRIAVILWSIVLSALVQAFLVLVQQYLLGWNHSRVSGTFLNPNYTANFMLMGLNISFLFLIQNKGKKDWRQWFTGFVALLLLWALIITGSRGAALALIFLACFHVIVLGRRLLLPLLLCFILLWLVPNPIKDRLLYSRYTKSGDMHPFERIEIWKQSARIMVDHPVLGVSLGNFEDHTYSYNFPVERSPARYAMLFKKAHNGLLQIGAEIGIPGLLAILWILIVLFRKTLKGLRVQNDGGLRLYLYIAATCLFGLAVHGMVSNNISSPPIVVLALTLTCVISWIYKIGLRPSTKPLKQWMPIIERHFLTLPVALLVLIVMLVCFWPFFCLNPYIANKHFERSKEWLGTGKIEMAEKALKRAIYFIPGQPYYYQSLGKIHLYWFKNIPLEEHIEKAISNYSRAIDINARQPGFYFDLAQAMETAQEIAVRKEPLIPPVLQNYHRAISLAPKNAFYRLNLALFYMKIERPLMAIKTLKEAISLEPNFINAHFFLAKIYRRIGKEKESRHEEMTVELLRKRFERYTPLTHYERLLFMMPEDFLSKIRGI